MARPQRKRKKSPQAQQNARNKEVSNGVKEEDHVLDNEDPNHDIEDFTVAVDQKEITCRRQGPQGKQPALLFTHGAGGGIDNPAIKSFADGFASAKSPVVCFKGTMNLKNRTKAFGSVIEYLREQHPDPGSALALGGRSMGARAAVLAAQDSTDISVLVLVSYPLKSAKGEVRDHILLDIPKEQNVLFISGDNDNMCDLDQLAAVRKKMQAKTWLIVVVGADHGMSLKPKEAVDPLRKKTGEIAAQWIEAHDSISTESNLSWNETDHLVICDEVYAEEDQPKSPKSKGKRGPSKQPPAARKRRKRGGSD